MVSQLRVLDLFSGLNGRGDPFREAGHEVFAIDIAERFTADAYLDIGDVATVLEALPRRPDVVFAIPQSTRSGDRVRWPRQPRSG